MERTKHILIVDDEQQMLNALEFIFMSAGYKVACARHARQAKSYIDEARRKWEPVDLLVTDIQMPEITGIQLIENLRDDGVKVPVLAITGYGDKDMIIELMRLGVKDFKDKPFEPEELLSQVKQLFIRLDSEQTEEQERLAAMERERADLEGRIERYLADIEQLKEKVTQAYGENSPPPAKAVEVSASDGDFTVWSEDDHVIIQPQGNLTQDMAAKFRALLIGMLDRGQQNFRFDMRRVGVVDTLCFSIFLVLAKTLVKQNSKGRLELTGASRELRNLFRLTHMDGVYKCID